MGVDRGVDKGDTPDDTGSSESPGKGVGRRQPTAARDDAVVV